MPTKKDLYKQSIVLWGTKHASFLEKTMLSGKRTDD